MPSLPRPRIRRGVVPGAPAATAEPDAPRVDVVEAHGLRWINLPRPGRAERAWLEEQFDFHELDMEDVASRNQRPKVDVHDDYLFVVMHFPVFDKGVGRLNAAEVDMFVGPDYVITVPNQPVRTIDYLFGRCEQRDAVRDELFSKGTGYLLYRLVDACVDASFPMLRKVGNKLESLEEGIFEGRSREIVRDLSNVKQEIINFRKIVRPQRQALKDLNAARRYLAGELDVYFDDVNDASERIWDMLENFKEVSEALQDTNESVLQHQQMNSLNVLTAITVMVLPLTLIASVWGMNVRVPGEGSLLAFWLVIGAMAVVLGTMLRIFRRRGWL